MVLGESAAEIGGRALRLIEFYFGCSICVVLTGLIPIIRTGLFVLHHVVMMAEGRMKHEAALLYRNHLVAVAAIGVRPERRPQVPLITVTQRSSSRKVSVAGASISRIRQDSFAGQRRAGHEVLAARPVTRRMKMRACADPIESATLSSMGADRLLFRIEGAHWGIGIGLMLQLARADVPFTVDADFAKRFDPNLAASGEEDVLVTLGGLDEHQQLAARPGNATLAASNWRMRLYVDAVSLVDHPEYRRNGAP